MRIQHDSKFDSVYFCPVFEASCEGSMKSMMLLCCHTRREQHDII